MYRGFFNISEIGQHTYFLCLLAHVLTDILLEHSSQWKLRTYSVWFHANTFMHVHFIAPTVLSSPLDIGLTLWDSSGTFHHPSSWDTVRSWIACTYMSILLYISPLWHPWVVRKQEWEMRRGREVCDDFVWEMAGGLRLTVAGLAEGRKERLFKRLPTDSCSPIEPPHSAMASHGHSPSARREI